MTIFSDAAGVIAARGIEAAGCDCLYHAAAADPGVACVLKIASKPVRDAAPGRGGLGIPTQTRMIVTFMAEVGSTTGKFPVGVEIKPTDYFTVPGHKVGRPQDATVKMRVGKDVRLTENSYWTGELSLL